MWKEIIIKPMTSSVLGFKVPKINSHTTVIIGLTAFHHVMLRNNSFVDDQESSKFFLMFSVHFKSFHCVCVSVFVVYEVDVGFKLV